MSVVVISSQDSNLQDLLLLEIGTSLLMNPVIRKNTDEVLEILKKIDFIDLIILDLREVNNLDAIKIMQNYISTNNLMTKIATIGLPQDMDGIINEKDVKNWKEIIFKFMRLTEMNELDVKQREVFEYLPIPSRMFRFLSRLPDDVFIKLKQDNQNKYIKRFNKDDIISPDDFKHLLNKIENFYVETKRRHKFVKAIADTLITKIKEHSSSPSLAPSVTDQFQIVQLLTQEMGFTQEVQNLVNDCLDDIVDKTIKAPKLKKFLEEVYQSSNQGVQAKINQMTILTCGALLNFVSDAKAKEKLRTLSFVALFHDFLLDDETVLIRSEDEIPMEASIEERRLVLHHAKAASLYFMNYPEVSDECIQIIREHHGSKKGIGFPDMPEPGLNELSYLFRICEELAFQTVEAGDIKSLPKILEKMTRHFKTKESSVYLKALKEISQISLLN